MIDAFRALESWLQRNNINPAGVHVTITADAMPADAIGRALRRTVEEVCFVQTGTEPIREGHIYGIKFDVADRISD